MQSAVVYAVKPVLKRLLKGLKRCGLLTKVSYSEKCTFDNLQWWSLIIHVVL